MTQLRRISVFSILLLAITTVLSFTINNEIRDVRLHSQNVSVVISGTSTMHDWTMKSDKGQVELLFGMTPENKLSGLTGLKFNLEAESLKSDKTMMDKNAYKALKTSSAKQISFILSSATISVVNETSYQVKAIGKLTVAGTTKETSVIADVRYNPADQSFLISGSKKIKMTEYNVKPPSFMMGAVKTGDEITISFKTKIINR